MPTARRQILDWESRWFVPVGIASFLAAAVLIGSNFVITDLASNGHSSDFLVSAHEKGGSVALYAGLQALGYLLLALPLYFLFRATAARNDSVRKQLVGVMIAAPVFFAIAAIMTGISTSDAADRYVNGEARPEMTKAEAADECRAELQDKGKADFAKEWDDDPDLAPLAECEATEIEDDRADEALSESSLQGLSIGFGLAGRLGLAIGLLYTCLNAMRAGLLTRFWGSLGMALGVASLLLAPIFVLIFFIYFGLLALGKLPGGRPPAWAAGEAIPWPTPGEKAADEMKPKEPEAEVVSAPEPPAGGDGDESGDGGSRNGSSGGGPRRKRKRRS